jgi:hypothetical protein
MIVGISSLTSIIILIFQQRIQNSIFISKSISPLFLLSISFNIYFFDMIVQHYLSIYRLFVIVYFMNAIKFIHPIQTTLIPTNSDSTTSSSLSSSTTTSFISAVYPVLLMSALLLTSMICFAIFTTNWISDSLSFRCVPIEVDSNAQSISYSSIFYNSVYNTMYCGYK